MDLHKFVSGKKMLNQNAHHLVQNGAAFHVHYWGIMPKHYDNSFHKHSFYELCYVADGEGAYLENDCIYPLQKNTLFFSRPEVVHQIQSNKGISLVYVAFELVESESVKEWANYMGKIKQCPQFVIQLKEEDTVQLLWKALLTETMKTNNYSYEDMLPNLAVLLIHSMLRLFTPDSQINNKTNTAENTSFLLTQAKLYIKDNLANDLKLSQVASHLHISSRHLSRIFVSEVGINFSKYVQRERINKAATLLKTTDLSIKDIAGATGFIDVHYFTRVFTVMMRQPPGRFRTLYMNAEKTIYLDE